VSNLRSASESQLSIRIFRAVHLAAARAAAVEAAVAAGAVRETVEVVDAEDVPLAYYPGRTNRVKVKAAGDLSS